MSSRELKITYTGDPRGALGAIKQIEDAHASFGDRLRQTGQKISSAGKSLTAGLTLPIVGFGIAAVKAFTEADKVAAQTTAVLESTGGAAGVTAKQVGKLATQIQNYSGMSDEAVAEGENLLLTFTSIRNEAGKGNDVFTQTTKIMADMSVALGQDAKTSALQLGKALNDPVKGLTALQRVGVSFTEAQEKQITKMVEAGDVMGAQKVILAELSKEFGGSAKAIGETAAGQWEIAKQQIGNAMETIGKVIVDVLVPAFQKVVGALQGALDWFNNLDPGMQNIIVTIGAVVAAVGPLVFVVGKLVSAFGLVLNAVKVVTVALTTNPYIAIAAATIAIVTLIVLNWDKVKAFLIAAWERIKEVAKFIWDNIAPFVIGPMKFAIDWLIDHWRGVVTVLGDIWHGIQAVAHTVWGVIREVIVDPVIAAKDKIVDVFRAVKDFLGDLWGTIKDAASAAWQGLWDVIKAVLNTIIRATNLVIKGVNAAAEAAANVVSLGFVNVPDIPPIPTLAKGGIVRRPTLAVIGESGPEAIVPLSRGRGGGIVETHIHFHEGTFIGTSPRELAALLVDPIKTELIRQGRSNGNIFGGLA